MKHCLCRCRWGPLGYLAYGGVYALLELAIIPAIPLTMTAGVLFGVLPVLAVVSASGTLAATLSFLIARYAARDKVHRLCLSRCQSGCCTSYAICPILRGRAEEQGIAEMPGFVSAECVTLACESDAHADLAAGASLARP